MAFVRPILADLVERVQEDFVSRLSLSGPILRRSMVYALARVVAGAAHLLHGFIEFLSRQVFPDQAEETYLLRWGALFGVTRTAAAAATGNVTITGTTGTVIPAGTLLQRADGAEYATDSEATLAAGTITTAVTAVVAGEDGNCLAGVTLAFEAPIAGATSPATVASGDLTGGSDEEDIEDYRARVIARMQSPPHGGNAADYVAWAKEVAGVTRAWCYPLEGGAGTVTVRFVRDDDSGSIIPSAGEVSTVQTYIGALAPVTATVTVAAPTPSSLNFNLRVTPDTTAVRNAVEEELADMILRIASPGGTIPLSQIEVAVGTADGVTDFSIVSPAADVTHATGVMAVMGTCTWT